MKKLISITIFLVLWVTSSFSQGDNVIGYWLTENGDSQIHIFKNSKGQYSGKVVWLKEDQEAKDDKNPDEKLQQRKILGLQILNNFSFDQKNKEWVNGTIYDPESGKTYDCFMWFEGDNNILRLKGYVLGMRFLSRQTNWKREKALRTINK